jgi:hypothetical protein
VAFVVHVTPGKIPQNWVDLKYGGAILKTKEYQVGFSGVLTSPGIFGAVSFWHSGIQVCHNELDSTLL